MRKRILIIIAILIVVLGADAWFITEGIDNVFFIIHGIFAVIFATLMISIEKSPNSLEW